MRDTDHAERGPPPSTSTPAPAISGPALSRHMVFLVVFLPFALGHYLSTLLRMINATLAADLTAALALTPGQLGLLTSAFFFAFALAQLPVGVALDRWGPARVQLPLLVIAALGTLAFAGGRDFTELLVARAVIGLGVGGCFMAAVKALSTWIAPARLPSVQGYLIAAGGLGAASATLPVRMALEHTDWRSLFVGLASALMVTGVLIRLLAPPQAVVVQRQPLRAAMAEILRHPSFREAAQLVLVPHMVFFGIQGLWIGRWLGDVAGYAEDRVSWLLYLGMGAVIAGAVGVGMITEWAGRRGVRPVRVAAAGVALFVIVQAGFVAGWRPGQASLAVLFTLVGTVTGIEYTMVAQGLPGRLTGRAATCLNLLIFLGAFAVQAGFGQVLECWRPNALGQYPAQAYQAGFALLVALQVPGLAWYGWRRWRRPARSGKMDHHPATSPR